MGLKYLSIGIIYYNIVDWIERDLVANEGGGIAGKNGITLEQCQTWCDQTDGCNSVSYNADNFYCFLKNKCLTKDEPSKICAQQRCAYKSYYRPCMTSGMGILLQITE